MKNTVVEVAIRSRIVRCVNPGDIPLSAGEHVIVSLGAGRALGKVLGEVVGCASKEKSCGSRCTTNQKEPSCSIRRSATDADLLRAAEYRTKEETAFRICKDKIVDHGLNMKLVDVEYQFGGGKITFYFTADQRVDFRALVKTLAGEFRTRIELRQIGVRDAAKLINGVGICGRPQCCSSFMREFDQISTQLAKDQQLTLNPAKISGNCGRLLCCLNFEEDAYLKAYQELPRSGASFTDAGGKEGTVIFVDIFKKRIHVRRFVKGMSQFEWYSHEEILKGSVNEAPNE
ncbi:PSP1 domain-containing protein [Chitinivibrio alkaliphilus]|uniref:PSP1 domain protein n=1 Tax=Chitinivibrio alkaliphilus ACht1 TaxID=1313304 RepID=U7D4B1_9BACT|nr:regulatory iron-sulfur-containing complex subunit RicT [Chitinivibrio alkaliphilus]ERP30803.1 PSP1 domain protein [Chitinivibrio alkaliphilus ACht1]